MRKPIKFSLGKVVATPGALEAIDPLAILTLLGRHASGDWGDTAPEDALLNDASLNENDASLTEEYPGRVMSVYKVTPSTTIWIITEWDRSVTTVLLPREY